MTLQERMKAAMEYAGMSRIELARACGVSHAAVYGWLTGRSKELAAGNAQKAAAAMGVNAGWLSTGAGEMLAGVIALGSHVPPPPGAVAVPEYGVRFGAGAQEQPTFGEETESVPAFYREDFFTSRRIKPSACRCFRVRGDSMMPVLWDGDRILVDCSPGQAVIAGRIYAFTYAGELRVKRLYPRLDGSMLLKSENPDVPDETVPADDMDRFGLVGRVLDREGTGPF